MTTKDPGSSNLVPSKFRRITLDMILGATSLTRSRAETNEAYLGRVTHLHLQGKGLRKIEKLDLCTHLKVRTLFAIAVIQACCLILTC